MTSQTQLTSSSEFELIVRPAVHDLRAALHDPATSVDTLATLLRVNANDAQAKRELAARAGRLWDEDAELARAVRRLADADAPGQIREGLERAWAYQLSQRPTTMRAPTLTVTLTLIDGADARHNEPLHGMTGPSIDDIWVGCWPSDANVGSIGACAVHEFTHALRNANVLRDEGFSLAYWIVSEGAAEEFIVSLYGESAPFLEYTQLTDRQVDDALPRVVEALETVSGFPEFGRYVFGDPAIGLPPQVGYAVGRRLVGAYMRSRGASAADVILAPTRDIVDAWKTAAP